MFDIPPRNYPPYLRISNIILEVFGSKVDSRAILRRHNRQYRLIAFDAALLRIGKSAQPITTVRNGAETVDRYNRSKDGERGYLDIVDYKLPILFYFNSELATNTILKHKQNHGSKNIHNNILYKLRRI